MDYRRVRWQLNLHEQRKRYYHSVNAFSQIFFKQKFAAVKLWAFRRGEYVVFQSPDKGSVNVGYDVCAGESLAQYGNLLGI